MLFEAELADKSFVCNFSAFRGEVTDKESTNMLVETFS
jgi:hypothetical protein